LVVMVIEYDTGECVSNLDLQELHPKELVLWEVEEPRAGSLTGDQELHQERDSVLLRDHRLGDTVASVR